MIENSNSSRWSNVMVWRWTKWHLLSYKGQCQFNQDSGKDKHKMHSFFTTMKEISARTGRIKARVDSRSAPFIASNSLTMKVTSNTWWFSFSEQNVFLTSGARQINCLQTRKKDTQLENAKVTAQASKILAERFHRNELRSKTWCFTTPLFLGISAGTRTFQ